MTHTEAQAHPLFGLRGWLLTILVLHGLGLVAMLVEHGRSLWLLAGQLDKLFSFDTVFGLLLTGVLVQVVLLAVILFLGLVRHPGFRTSAIVLTTLSCLLHLGLIVYLSVALGELDPAWLLERFVQLGFSLAILAYFVASRRVRVTYQWLVAEDDPALTAIRASGSAAPPPLAALRGYGKLPQEPSV